MAERSSWTLPMSNASALPPASFLSTAFLSAGFFAAAESFVAAQGERAAGALLYQLLDLAFIAVRVERHRENNHRQDQKDHEARDHIQRNLDSFHRLISQL